MTRQFIPSHMSAPQHYPHAIPHDASHIQKDKPWYVNWICKDKQILNLTFSLVK